MDLKLDDMIKKHNSCVKNLDENKTCATCGHKEDTAYCEDCFNELLGFPVDPTNWTKHPNQEGEKNGEDN